MSESTRPQQAADAIAAVSGASPSEAKRLLSEFDLRDLVSAIAAEGVGGGSGTSPVSCVISRDNAFSIRTADLHPILWDALYDNYNDFGTLLAIPDGLGLSFAFDGSSSTITTTEAGVWALTYTLGLSPDNAWDGSLTMGFGLSQSLDLSASEGVAITTTTVLALNASATFDPAINTSVQATANPYDCGSAYLIATRLG